MKKLIVISAVLLSLAATSCQTRAVVTTRPNPPANVVVRPAAPRPDYVWVDGEWVWRGGRYVYVKGRWEPPRSGHVWVSGHWAKRGNGWTWEKGHWR